MKRTLSIIGLTLIAGLFISGMKYNNGSPGAKTGSPLDEENCSSCHSSSVTAQDWITTDIPAEGYTPGETYTITAAGIYNGVVKFGFELTAENASAKIGSFVITNSSETKMTNSNKAVTHTSNGITPANNQKSWSCDWVAPAEGTGNVTFYAAFNAANGNGSTSGDAIFESSLQVVENTSAGMIETEDNSVVVAPNPASDYINISNDNNIETIEIYDSYGRLINKFEKVNTKEYQLNLSEYSSSIYFLRIKSGNDEFIKKINLR